MGQFGGVGQLQALPRLNERNLRPIIGQIDWHEQRRMFQKFASGSGGIENQT